MYKLLFFAVFLIGKCLSDGEFITLDLAYNANHSRFIKMYHYFRGIQYITLTPMIGYRIGKVIYGDNTIYVRVEGDESLETVFIFYNEDNYNIPIFILKSATIGHKFFPLCERSPHDEENYLCALTLMRYVKLLIPNHKIQLMLRDIDNEDPPELTLNTLIYRVFHGSQYLGGHEKIRYGRISTDEEMRSRCMKPNIRKRQRRYDYDNEDKQDSKKSN